MSRSSPSSAGFEDRQGQKYTRADPRRVTTALVIACVLLPIASEVKVRNRSPSASLIGNVDGQVGAELAIWIVGLAVIGRLIAPQLARIRPPRSAGARYAFALAALIVLGTVLAEPSSVVYVRGAQTVAILLVIVACAPLSGANMRNLVRSSGSVLLWISLVLLAITVLAPQFSLMTEPSYFGVQRLRFLEMHPLTTANLLVLGFVINATILASTEYRLTGRSLWLKVVGTALAGLGLLLTGSRGTVFGAVVALAIIAFFASKMAPIRARRNLRIAGLTIALAAVLSAGVIIQFALRGAGADALLTINSRTELLRGIIRLWSDSIWVGFGHLSGRTMSLDRLSGSGTVTTLGTTDNLFGEALLSYGLVGAVFVIAGLVGALVRSRRLSLRGSPFAPIFIALLAVLISQSIVQDGFLGPPGLELSTLALIFLLGWQRLATQAESLPRRGTAPSNYVP